MKVDGASLQAAGKENAAPRNNAQWNKENAGPLMSKEDQERQRQREEWEARQAEAQRVEEQRREMERRVREEQERQQAEQRRREAERRRQQLEQEQREREELFRIQEEERQRHEEQRQRQEEEYRRQEEAAEQARQAEEARRRKSEEAENGKRVQLWLQTNGFKGVNDIVRKRLTKYRPLHFAVQKNDDDMIRRLIVAGADRRADNGKKETPLQLAQRLDKAGSHSAVIRELSKA